ncbi:type I restriction enzyme M protein [Streptomyces sp. LBL]|uniref:N-6 DNA methylase n=1 Tax=Streptomyces sp. LBL TaxID=2940562 RepID=UPI0024770A6A|nr:N-6 DNA methylase [Streptomyces sp. LBL]MDH6628444.1 type I restriction enzyme M protein [Streptomyces sp. LBL]
MTDSEFAGVLVSRPDIARLAGVKRPAVTNWQRRHADFPLPTDPGADVERFRADEVLVWLSGRTIPANALRPGEPVGTTYGDRFRAGLPGGTAGGLLRTVERLAGPEADRLRGPMQLDRYLLWLLYLVLNQVVEPDDGLAKAVDSFREMVRDFNPPKTTLPRRLLAELADTLARTSAGSVQESRKAFDHVLVRWRAAHAREGGAFFTPPSVSRVMAGALAAVRPGAVRVHDPYGRTGELLVAYLDEVAAHGGALPRISGRVPDALERQVAEMNLRVHHGRAVRLGEGPFTPALDPFADPPGAFDVLLTNPPFGRRLEDVDPPPYWPYGTTRRSEFDWLQYAVSRLAPKGQAAVLMPAGAAFNAGAAATVRAGLVEAGAVECVIALPAGLFTLTTVKTQIWFLRSPGSEEAGDPEVLFVAGEHLGHHVTRTQRILTDDEVMLLVGEYVSWHAARAAGRFFEGTPGLSRAVPLSGIAAHGHSLDPALYAGPPGRASGAREAGPAVTRERLARLTEEITSVHARAEAADAEAARWLRRYGL